MLKIGYPYHKTVAFKAVHINDLLNSGELPDHVRKQLEKMQEPEQPTKPPAKTPNAPIADAATILGMLGKIKKDLARVEKMILGNNPEQPELAPQEQTQSTIEQALQSIKPSTNKKVQAMLGILSTEQCPAEAVKEVYNQLTGTRSGIHKEDKILVLNAIIDFSTFNKDKELLEMVRNTNIKLLPPEHWDGPAAKMMKYAAENNDEEFGINVWRKFSGNIEDEHLVNAYNSAMEMASNSKDSGNVKSIYKSIKNFSNVQVVTDRL